MVPCKDCLDRVVGCHIECERYKAYLEENERIKEEKRQSYRYLSPRARVAMKRNDIVYTIRKRYGI